MKLLLTLALLSTVVSSAAHARYIGPGLVREFRTGFTLPEYTRSETCSIYGDRVVKKVTKFDGIEQTWEKSTFLAVTLGDLQVILKRIQKAPLTLSNGFVDGPKIVYTGFQIQPNDTVKSLVIGSDNGDTGEFHARESADARLLRSFMDVLCDSVTEADKVVEAPVEETSSEQTAPAL
jgi:hypothetical protein